VKETPKENLKKDEKYKRGKKEEHVSSDGRIHHIKLYVISFSILPVLTKLQPNYETLISHLDTCLHVDTFHASSSYRRGLNSRVKIEILLLLFWQIQSHSLK